MSRGVVGPWRAGLFAVGAAVGLTHPAPAWADCPLDTPYSGCFAADPVWLEPSPGDFATVAPARVAPRRTALVGLGVSHAASPVVLVAPSPAPGGREIPVVERVTTATLLAAYAFPLGTELSLALPFTLDQQGTGVAGITSQSAPALRAHPPRDPRLTVAQELWELDAALRAAAGARYTLLIPLGDAAALAGERGFVGAPAFTLEVEWGRLFAATELDARLRAPVTLASARIGSDLGVATGIGVALLPPRRLTAAAEAFVRPSLVRQPVQDGGRGTLVPAEWLVSLRSTPFAARGPTLLLGVGGGLPLSSSGGDPEPHLGVTSPRLRVVTTVSQPLKL